MADMGSSERTEAYLERQQNFLDGIKQEIINGSINNTNQTIGAHILTYELINDPSKPFFKGNILFGNKQVREVCFVKSEEERAKKIFAETSKLNNNAILKLWFTTYCQAINSWILCYDKFDHLLGDWVTKKKSKDRMRKNGAEDLLEPKTSIMLRSLLEGITCVHNHGLFHQSLHLSTSYVVLSNTIKIINIGMHSLKDLPMPDDETVNDLRMQDLLGFKAVLEEHILLPGVAWADRDIFLQFFGLTNVLRYENFVQKLMEHPFMETDDYQRLKYFFNIRLAFQFGKLQRPAELIRDLQKKPFLQYRGWNTVLSYNLKSIYAYEDDKVQKKTFNGNSIMDLIGFLRDVFRHPRGNSLAELDSDVRKAYPGFLLHLHQLLCRLEYDRTTV